MPTVDEIAPNVPRGLELGLRNYWYPIAESADVGERPIALTSLGEPLAAWRDAEGRAHVFADWCPHRGARLSIGSVAGNSLQCIWHGIQYAGDGRCAFIPWEDDDSPVLSELRVQSYPVEELHGLLFAYIGEPDRFPPAPLREELPAELYDAEYEVFIMTEVWNTNWLLAIDGADKFHVPFLHAQSATRPAGGQQAAFGADGRRIQLQKVQPGVYKTIALDATGQSIFTGQGDPDFAEEKAGRFLLPALTCVGVIPSPGVQPHHVFLWLFPIDAEHTRVTRFVSRRAVTDQERAEWAQYFKDVVKPRTEKISSEDAVAAVSAGGLALARSREHLLAPDEEVYRRRVLLRDAFLAQRQGVRFEARRGQRAAVESAS